MDEYIKKYDLATKRVLENAQKIDSVALQHIDTQYTLYDIANVLRDKFKDHLFRDRYVGDMQFMGPTKKSLWRKSKKN